MCHIFGFEFTLDKKLSKASTSFVSKSVMIAPTAWSWLVITQPTDCNHQATSAPRENMYSPNGCNYLLEVAVKSVAKARALETSKAPVTIDCWGKVCIPQQIVCWRLIAVANVKLAAKRHAVLHRQHEIALVAWLVPCKLHVMICWWPKQA